MPARPLIDFHTHPFVPEDLAPATWDFVRGVSPAIREHGERLRDVSYAVDVLRAEGVEHAVVLPEHCPQTSGNVRTERVLELCQRSAGFFLPFASVDINTDPEPVALLAGYIDAGVRGLKLYPSYQFYYPNDDRLYPIYELCQQHRLPVLMHIGSSVIPGTRMKYCDPIHLDDVAVDFPDMCVVMAHGGRGFWYEACMFLAAHYENFYIDVAGLVPHRLVEHFPRLSRHTDKFVFGTDWPAMPKGPAANAAAIAGLGLDDDAVDRILRRNAARLLGIPLPPPETPRR